MAGPASSTLHETDDDKDSLHIAARSGEKEKMLQILGRRPFLIYQQNMIGDNPLHVAAEAGQLGIVELLIAFFQSRYSSQSIGSTENRAEEKPSVGNDEDTRIEIQADEITNPVQLPQSSDQIESRAGNIELIEPIWKTKNHDGSTALHEALRNKHEDVALYLLDVDSEPVEFANHKMESPLYLAAKAGYVRVLNNILEGGRNPSTVGPKGQTPFHAAVFAKSQESIRVLHGSIPKLIDEPDSNGKTALYHATQEDSVEIMHVLLGLDPYFACKCDNKGLSPLSVAVRKGRPASVQVLIDACPNSKRDDLVNKQDEEGNTALHLAIIGQKYQHVQTLLSSGCVDLTAKNHHGQTASDLCRDLSCQQGLIPEFAFGRLFGPATVYFMQAMEGKDPTVIQTLAVMATLIATLTFAAAIQIPGGYKDDGSPILIHKSSFIIFVWTDAFAFCVSVAAMNLLVLPVFFKSFTRISIGASIVLINLALFSSLAAFVSGLYAVISIEAKWVAILVTIICLLSQYASSIIFYWEPIRNLVKTSPAGRVQVLDGLYSLYCGCCC